MTALDRVCGVLDQHGVAYALIGAAALAAHGVSRSTFDIDLLTTDLRTLDRRFWSSLPDVEVRRGDLDDPLAGVVRAALPGEQPIDVVVGRHAWQARAVERARPFGAAIPVVSAADLILLKLYAGGSHDLWDVRELTRHVAPAVLAEVTAAVQALEPHQQQQWEKVLRGENS